ncbi:MAG: hypothetical protein ABR913_03790 [Sedimentisphaerales bacterium]|jgi:hypothetical protein
MLRTIGLIRFLKGDHDNNVPGCANYDYHDGGCLLGAGCKVEAGSRQERKARKILEAAGYLVTKAGGNFGKNSNKF